MMGVYFDWNVWSILASREVKTNTLLQRFIDNGVKILISPIIIEEMCQAPPNVIDSAKVVIKELKSSPILRHPNEIEVNELLTEISHSCPNLISKGVAFNSSIFGEGNSQADKDWQELLKYGSSFIDSKAIEKITKNKLINRYYQSLLKHGHFFFDAGYGTLPIDKATAKINKISQLWTQPENLSVKDLKNEIKKVNQKPLNSIIAKWDKYKQAEKEKVVAKFCKSQVVSEYLLPIYDKQIYRSTKVAYFLQALTISDFNDALELVNCLCDKIDYKKIPSLWISLAVTILQETKKIQESNVYDQMHAVYLKELDCFLTCDKKYYDILSCHLMKHYLKSIGSGCKVIYLKPEDTSVEMIISTVLSI